MSSLFDELESATPRKGWRPKDQNLADLFDSLEEYYTESFTQVLGEAVAKELAGLSIGDLLEVESRVTITHPRNYKRLPGADVFRKIVLELPPPRVKPDLSRTAITDGYEPGSAQNMGQMMFALFHEWKRKGITFTAEELEREAKARLRERSAS